MKTFRVFLFLFVNLFLTKIAAQDVQMVTLQHSDNTSVFYGADGFVNAVNAAVDGDLITLSAGTFNPPTINKVLTIQGSGYVNDVANNRYRTVLADVLNVSIPNGKEGLTIEGIYTDGSINFKDSIVALTLKKCYISSVNFTGKSVNCNINQCKIGYLTPDASSDNLFVTNSVINLFQGNSTDALLSFQNDYLGSFNNYTTANFKNNIIRNVSNMTSQSSAYNNVVQENYNYITGLTSQSGNWNVSLSNIFANSSETSFNVDYLYKITDSAATTYVGTDGTRVGLYGGTTSFTNVPSNPQITKRDISEKSTTDGLLKVNITVEAQK